MQIKRVIIAAISIIIIFLIMFIPMNIALYEDLPSERIRLYQLCMYLIIFTRYKYFIIGSISVISVFLSMPSKHIDG